MTFSIFTFLWCTLSCYIYSKPHDGPSGTSFVSLIRRIPFLKWFFQQPRIPLSQQKTEEIKDETEKEALKSNHVIEMTSTSLVKKKNKTNL